MAQSTEIEAVDLRRLPDSSAPAPDGYAWAVLNEAYPSLSGSPARALVCTRCGGLVGVVDQHDSWHREVARP